MIAVRRALALLVLALSACAPDPRALERQARTQVYQKLSTPDLPAVVGPAVMQADFAIVDFTRGNFQGGRVLLRRDKNAWTLALCGGEPLRKRPTIERAGVPDGTAGVLMTKLLREESRLDSARRDQFDKWRTITGVNCPEPKAP